MFGIFRRRDEPPTRKCGAPEVRLLGKGSSGEPTANTL
jgi:hypothetical protein